MKAAPGGWLARVARVAALASFVSGSGGCVDDISVRACDDDTPCPAGQHCSDGRCAPGASSDAAPIDLPDAADGGRGASLRLERRGLRWAAGGPGRGVVLRPSEVQSADGRLRLEGRLSGR